MTKAWAAGLVLAGLMAVTALVRAGDLEFFTGQMLAAHCGAKPADADYATHSLQCAAYVLGVSDAQQASQAGGGVQKVRLPADGERAADRRHGFRLPAGASGQAAAGRAGPGARGAQPSLPLPVTERPTLRDLFTAFFSIALSGFGGVLPFARRMLVDQRGWLTGEDFTETLSLCQSLPGPNVVNMSIVVGSCGRAAGRARLSRSPGWWRRRWPS